MVSSNSWPSLKEISVFLKVLSVLIVIISPFLLMITVGLAKFPSFLVANPTPVNQDSVRTVLTQRAYREGRRAARADSQRCSRCVGWQVCPCLLRTSAHVSPPNGKHVHELEYFRFCYYKGNICRF